MAATAPDLASATSAASAISQWLSNGIQVMKQNNMDTSALDQQYFALGADFSSANPPWQTDFGSYENTVKQLTASIAQGVDQGTAKSLTDAINANLDIMKKALGVSTFPAWAYYAIAIGLVGLAIGGVVWYTGGHKKKQLGDGQKPFKLGRYRRRTVDLKRRHRTGVWEPEDDLEGYEEDG